MNGHGDGVGLVIVEFRKIRRLDGFNQLLNERFLNPIHLMEDTKVFVMYVVQGGRHVLGCVWRDGKLSWMDQSLEWCIGDETLLSRC